MPTPDLISFGSDYVNNLVTPKQIDSALPSPMLQPGMPDIAQILRGNSDKNFVQRIFNYDQSPKLDAGDGQVMTHKMSYVTDDNGAGYVYPQVFQHPQTGKLYHIPDGQQAWQHARDTGQFIKFDDAKHAAYFANGAYKSFFNIGNKISGVPSREPYDSEREFFKTRTDVGGMAAEDGQIVLNPYTNLSSENKAAVAKNEATRIRLRENPNLLKGFQMTPQQISSTQNYSPNWEDRVSTIIARLNSGDPSAGTPTDAQLKYMQQLQQGLNLLR